MSGPQLEDAAFDDRPSVLDQLVAAYDGGLLVPFIGAGMSYPVCRLWPSFVAALEDAADCARFPADSDLVHRAARAVRKLRFGSGKSLAEAVRLALLKEPGARSPPPQTKAVANIFWPLVMTTNYDDLYLAEAHEAHLLSPRLLEEEKRESPLLLLGRSTRDCQRVLTSLRQPDRPILWALQGFVGGQARAPAAGKTTNAYHDYLDDEDRKVRTGLESELVVGHAEYRRVAMASEAFRRAFGEVYRSRSMLFLGSGLRDKYFLDLFSEIIELYGPSPHPHYALLKTGEFDESFLRQYFGIWVDPIANHDELPARLGELKQRVDHRRARQVGWHFGPATVPRSRPFAGQPGLRIVRGRLPHESPAGECIVFSAGGKPGEFKLSIVGQKILEADGVRASEDVFELREDIEPGGIPLWQYEERRMLAVQARVNPWTEDGARIRPTDPTRQPIGPKRASIKTRRELRDVRVIPLAVQQFMQAAHTLGYRHVHSMLLAAGPLRTFPRSQALLQMARGWMRWHRNAKDAHLGFSIYLTDDEPDVLSDLDAGRLDLGRHLLTDVVEFWLEIEQGGESERFLDVAPADKSLLAVLDKFDIDSKRNQWKLELTPHPCLKWKNWDLAGVRAWERHFGTRLDLDTFGVLPGSTLRLTPSE
jgi:SIR2-like domain